MLCAVYRARSKPKLEAIMANSPTSPGPGLKSGGQTVPQTAKGAIKGAKAATDRAQKADKATEPMRKK
jgi:hypothetical protein